MLLVEKQIASKLLQLDDSPEPFHDGIPDLLRRLSRFGHLLGKEDLLETHRSPGAVVGRVTVEEAPMAEPLAVAVTGLLSEHVWNFLGDRVRPGDKRDVKSRRIQGAGKWLCVLRVGVKRRHVLAPRVVSAGRRRRGRSSRRSASVFKRARRDNVVKASRGGYRHGYPPNGSTRATLRFSTAP